MCLTVTIGAQSPRPTLRLPNRDFLAGKLLLVPASTHPDALALPRQLAQIADHELRTPPVNLLATSQSAALNEWLRKYDFAATDGLLVAVNQLGTETANTLTTIHQRFPHLRIAATGQSEAIRSLLDNEVIAIGWPAENLNSGLLLARWLNERFGFTPPVASLLSGKIEAALSADIAHTLTLLGNNAAAFNTTAPHEGLRLIIHAPQTTDTERGALVSAIATLASNGARIALADLNPQADQREALMRALRERKLLDRLASYAAVSALMPSANEACQRALVQANLWLIALNFLRDDTERLRRIERAQIAALISAYLREAIFPALKDAAPQTGKSLEQNEAAALAALKPAAEELFNEQFKRNVHALLLNTGERAEFEIRLLQRVLVRWPDTGQLTAAPEIRTDTHLVLLGTMLASPGLPRAGWELNNAAALDVRIGQRFDAIAWQTFKIDAPAASLSIKIPKASALDSAAAQSYSISNRRAGDSRRITVNAASAQAAFAALAQLEQLGANGKLAINGEWTEKPALAERGFQESPASNWSHRDRLEMLRRAGRARLNVFVYEPPTDFNASQLRELNAAAQQNFVSLVISLKLDETAAQDNERAFVALTKPIKALNQLGIQRFVVKQTLDESVLQRAQRWLANLDPTASIVSGSRWQWLTCAPSPLQSWALDVPTLDNRTAILCMTDAPHTAVLPMAWFGAHTWGGKSLHSVATLAETLTWLYDEKTRNAVNQWLTVLRGPSQSALLPVLAELLNVDATEVNASPLVENLARLQNQLNQLTTTREQGLLRGELFAVLKAAQQRMERLKTDARYERTDTGAYRRKTQR